MSRPAPAHRTVAALALLELRLLARRGESLLVTLVIPVAVLLFFAGTSVIPNAARPVDFLLPGAIALAIVASGLVSLGIATAYERHYGVLKRLGGAPITRATLVTAKVAAVGLVVALQFVVLAAVAALALGWTPGPAWSPAMLLGAVALGTATFAALGLLLAGTLRAEAVLALANALFLGFLMLGGIVLPVDHLPDWLRPIALALPATALGDLLRAALDSGTVLDVGRSTAVLAAWGIAGVALAVRAFRWEGD